jgi:hypothetical protein
LALPAPEKGRFGDDFLRRAADRSLAGVTANNPAEAVYLIKFRDADRARFEPDGSYQEPTHGSSSCGCTGHNPRSSTLHGDVQRSPA